MQIRPKIDPTRRVPNAVWAWEGLRRNPAYRAQYAKNKETLPALTKLESGASLIRLHTQNSPSEKYGLLCFADPDLSALETNLIWRPDWLAGALRVKLHAVQPRQKTQTTQSDRIVLSSLKTRRLLLDKMDGTRHIVLGGNRFWIQLYSNDVIPDSDHTEIDIRFDGTQNMQRRLDTASQLLSLHRSTGGRLSLIGRRKNTRPLANALNAYDIWNGFERPKGTLKDVAAMIVGPVRMNTDWGSEDRALKAQARRAIAKGTAFVEGGYREILAQKIL